MADMYKCYGTALYFWDMIDRAVYSSRQHLDYGLQIIGYSL